MKLLIAHDGSPASEGLLSDLKRAGLPSAGEAVVLSVADAWSAVGEGSVPTASLGAPAATRALEEAVAKARSISESGASRVREALTGWTVTARHCAGSPSWEIVRESDEWRPDLLVMGATGTTLLERLVFGTTVNQAVVHARCSVRVTRPPREGASGPVKIVLGTDGSTQALDAAKAVAARSWPAGSEVRLVTAVDGWMFAALEGPDTGAQRGDDALRAEMARLGDEAEALLAKAGLAVTRIVRDGDPKAVLVDEAASWGADCIVVGARGRRGLSRLLLGSVALGTVSRAACSVEVIRG